MEKFILLPEHIEVVSHSSGPSEYNRDALKTLYVLPDRVVSTDAYRLLEVTKTKTEHKPVLLERASLEVTRKIIKKSTQFIGVECKDSGAKLLVVAPGSETNTVATVYHAKYPDYEYIMPKEKPSAFISINASYLFALAAYIQKFGSGDNLPVIIELYGENKPAVFHADTVGGNHIRALIMPLHMSEEETAQRTPEEEKPEAVTPEEKKPGDTVKVEDLPF